MAMVILSSRQLLLSLLADWPTEGHCITGPLIGCQDSAHLPFILDLLNRTEASADFKQVSPNKASSFESSLTTSSIEKLAYLDIRDGWLFLII